MEFVGVIGSVCFAFCLLPQVIKAYHERSAAGISWLFILLSAVGNIASCAYVVYTNTISGVWQYPLYFNYGVALCLCIALAVAKIIFKNNCKDVNYWQNRCVELQKKADEYLDGLQKNFYTKMDDLLKEREVHFFEIFELKKFIESKGFETEGLINYKKFKCK